MAARTSTCEPHVGREALQCVCACWGRLVSSIAARGAGWVKKAATVAEDSAVLRWPSRSPDLFLWGYVKESVFLRPVPRDLSETWRRIVAAISEIVVTCCSGSRRKGLPAWRLPCHKERTPRALTMYEEKNLERFSFHLKVAYYNPFCHSRVPILWTVSEIINNPVYH